MKRAARWPSASIHTSGELHRAARRLNRRTAGVNVALQAMRRGEFLCLQYSAGRPCWSLSNGRTVSAQVADILTHNASIIPADGALFPDCVPAQTWKLGASNG
jgi:hypothetical protein